ncbi:DUF6343 family protein [Streptomyces sp. NPDC059373]
MRTGSEPRQARSPLRMRRAFTVWGLVWSVIGTAVFAVAGRPGWAIVFGVVAVLAAVDLAVIAHRIRQGPHWQPGPDVPPYDPADRH